MGGDHFADSRGLPVAVTGARELVQRALIRLAVRKASFPEDRALGSELYKLLGVRGQNLSRLARSYVQEALLPMPEIAVADVAVEELDGGLRLEVGLLIHDEEYQLEVDVV